MKLKALVAAIALVGAGAAHAAYQAPTAVGGGSLIFSAWDANQSLSIDLSTANSQFANFNAFVQGGAPAADITTNLGSLFTSTFGSNANVQWSVYAFKNIVDTTSRNGMLSTLNSTGTFVFNNGAVNNTTSGATNGALPGISAGLGTVQAVGTPGYAGGAWGTNYNNAAFLNNTSGAGVTGFFAGPVSASTVYAPGAGVGSFWQISGSSASATAAATKNLFGNAQGNAAWILSSNGDLTFHTAVAAVPEPETYALMLAGLGMVGLMARRRKA